MVGVKQAADSRRAGDVLQSVNLAWGEDLRGQ